MFKVLLVDDEPWALLGVRKTFPFEKEGFEVVGQTTNPIEAMELIKKHLPDVVFTDIRMPKYSGLDLMKFSKEQGLDIKFIVVSGYADFKYAQEAIKFGAFDYCLKPIEKEEACELIKRLKENLQLKHKQKEAALLNLLFDENIEVSDIFEKLGIKLEEEQFQMLIVSSGDEEIIKNNFETLNLKYIRISMSKEKKLYIVNVSNDIGEKFASLNVNIGITHLKKNFANIISNVKYVDVAYSQKFITKKSGVYYFENDKKRLTTQLFESIIKFYENKKVEELKIVVGSIRGFFITNEMNIRDLECLWHELSEYFNNRSIVLEDMDYYEMINNFSDIDELISSLYNTICVNDNFDKKECSSAYKNFDKVLEYIEENYGEEISLKKLANDFYISYTYCCEMFKKTKGVSFSEYLNKVRLTHATMLLMNTSLSIGEISEKVGYVDYCYFNRRFKKQYNITPLQFRKNCDLDEVKRLS